ncbi:MAG TPA: cellulose biosynthesis protein BcsG, partial [Burkholderiaceae bacterium]|nr:cellulose biosynthesis protein BcsG [Burkholderiaceae bacterium]
MGAWSLYFLAKLGLYYAHRIDLQWLINFALAVALALPLQRPWLRRIRSALAIPAAVALAYDELHLPPWMQLVDDAAALANFRAGYLLELARRADLLQIFAALALLVLVYAALRHRLRFATLTFLGLAMATLVPPSAPTPALERSRAYVRAGEPQQEQAAPSPFALDEVLRTFYGSEHGKTVNYARVGSARFDLVLLSVCSLSYDDLAYTHMREDPFLSRFDIIFQQFNSAATYSGPALLRLLHGTCGQTPQGELYNGTAADGCYLFHSLAAVGYQPALLLNHDGQFDHFAQQLREQGGMGIDPEDNRASPVFMTAFDGKPLRADFDVLSRWWMRHQRDEGHNALLYNTISLHDGNRIAGQATRSSIDSYTPRLRRLFADLGRFLDLVEASGRPTVVVLIPEHGAALRADAMQIAG